MAERHRGGVILSEDCWAWLRRIAHRDGGTRDDLLEGLVLLAMDEERDKAQRRKRPVQPRMDPNTRPRLEVFAVAATTRKGCMDRLHIIKDGSGMALCGGLDMRYIGETDMPDTEGWPWCPHCVRMAGPEVTEIWL
jgi:hypothetical protein